MSGYGYRRRRRGMSSDAVFVGSVATVSALVIGAAVVAAINNDEQETITADCVDTSSVAPDGSYQPVDDRFCDGGSHSGYVWVYGGSSSGGRIRGGSTIRPGDVGITSRSGRVIVRGGFGGRGSGGGG
ncbi:hypothetical protein HNP84_010293 [Thermocatellispora tengchongensis]|uniref:Uncharacterized protein n=1 Tax=Thermocatellispora tengchongensis TaxID=1073253 RepID=A0A840PXE6_9ACTN|nr:hypothetical protein [Thermocatellispora tengchongensis]MBB5140525.1 hypothetical protein [Thermocatellispora tengchongensis]